MVALLFVLLSKESSHWLLVSWIITSNSDSTVGCESYFMGPLTFNQAKQTAEQLVRIQILLLGRSLFMVL